LKFTFQTSPLRQSLETIELKSEVNDTNSDWKVLWKISNQTGDSSGYFFKTNSEIVKKIRQSCPLKSICTFKFEYDDLDYDKIKDYLPKDFSGASYYGEVKKVINVSN